MTFFVIKLLDQGKTCLTVLNVGIISKVNRNDVQKFIVTNIRRKLQKKIKHSLTASLSTKTQRNDI